MLAVGGGWDKKCEEMEGGQIPLSKKDGVSIIRGKGEQAKLSFNDLGTKASSSMSNPIHMARGWEAPSHTKQCALEGGGMGNDAGI